MKREDVVIVNELPDKVIGEVLHIGTDKNKWVASGHVKIGGGAYGRVYDVMGYAVKIYFDWDDDDVTHDDGVILDKLQGCELFPKLYAYVPKKFMIVEKIEGKVFHYVEDGDPIDDKWRESLKQAHKLVKEKGLVFADVHGDNVMLTTDGKIKIVDVGRMCRHESEREIDEVVEFVNTYYERATETRRRKITEAQVNAFSQFVYAI